LLWGGCTLGGGRGEGGRGGIDGAGGREVEVLREGRGKRDLRGTFKKHEQSTNPT